MTSIGKQTESPLYYLEDLSVGQRFVSDNYEITEAEIKTFAAQYDPQPFHLNEAAAKNSLFKGLAASGWHTGAIMMRLLVQGGLPIAGGIIGAGGELNWTKPTRPGDLLRIESEVLAITPSKSRPERGMATVRSETKNQKDEVVQVFTMKIVVHREAK